MSREELPKKLGETKKIINSNKMEINKKKIIPTILQTS
jgi:hypothetical protein